MSDQSSPTESRALRADVVTMLGAVTLGVVMLSPAMTIYGNFAASFAAAGKAAPLAFVIALLATLPTATSYALLSRDYPAAGSAAAWTARALSPRAARFLGWMTVLYYLTNFVLQPVTFGLFFRDLFGSPGGGPSFTLYALGAVLCCVLPAGLVYRGISPSTKGAFALLLLETVVVIALCVSSASEHPGGPLDVSGFSLQALGSAEGISGISRALVFAMLSFCGFDVISTLAEEARLARQLIPRATFLALLSFGLLIVLGIWSLTFAAAPARLQALADAPGMPITEVARDLWGRGSLLVTLTGLSAALGIVIATSVGASRVLFSMARDGLAPRTFARLHPITLVPTAGLHLVFGMGIAGALLVALIASPWDAYLWWGTTSTFFAMITFLFVNVCALLLFRPRARAGLGSFALYTALPLAGALVDAGILWRCFFVEAWHGGAMGRSAIAFDVGCALVAGAFAIAARAEPSVTPSAESPR